LRRLECRVGRTGTGITFNPTAAVNLITLNLHGEIEPTKYFKILENAISSIYTAETNAGI
jgi:hypothetical protein